MTTQFSGQDSSTRQPADIEHLDAVVAAQSERVGDEVRRQTVVDLLVVVLRWRNVALAVAATTLLLGVLATIVLPEKHEYSTTIEIARVESAGLLGGPLESIETVRAKLSSSYVPLVLARYRERRPDDDSNYEIAVSSPRGSGLVMLSSRAPVARLQTYLALHQEVVEELVADHSRMSSLRRSQIEAELGRAKVALAYEEDPSTLKAQESELESRLRDAEIKLQYLRDPEILEVSRRERENEVRRAETRLEELRNGGETIQFRLLRIEDHRDLLEAEIAELRREISVAMGRREAAVASVDSETRALTLLMIDSEIRQSRAHLATLELELLVHLENRRAGLESDLENNREVQESQLEVVAEKKAKLLGVEAETALEDRRESAHVAEARAKLANLQVSTDRTLGERRHEVAELEAQLENFHDTRPVISPIQSLRPVEGSRLQVLSIALVLGLVLGILSTFVADLLTRLRRRMAAE